MYLAVETEAERYEVLLSSEIRDSFAVACK